MTWGKWFYYTPNQYIMQYIDIGEICRGGGSFFSSLETIYAHSATPLASSGYWLHIHDYRGLACERRVVLAAGI